MITKTESIQIQGHDATKTIVTDDAGRSVRKTWTINEFDGNKNILYKEVFIKRFDTPDDHNILKQRTVYQKPPFSRFSFMNYVRTTKYANGHYSIEYGVRENDTEETYSTKELVFKAPCLYEILKEKGLIDITKYRKDKPGFVSRIKKATCVFHEKRHTESGGYIEEIYRSSIDHELRVYNAKGRCIRHIKFNKKTLIAAQYGYNTR